MLAGWGLTLDDFSSDPPVDVWPENLEATNVFIGMGRQWRVGMGGRTGLDFTSLPVVFDLMEVASDRRPGLFEQIRVMEDAALRAMDGKALDNA